MKNKLKQIENLIERCKGIRKSTTRSVIRELELDILQELTHASVGPIMSDMDTALTTIPRGRLLTSLRLMTVGEDKDRQQAWLSNGKAGQYVIGYHENPCVAVVIASLYAQQFTTRRNLLRDSK